MRIFEGPQALVSRRWEREITSHEVFREVSEVWANRPFRKVARSSFTQEVLRTWRG